MPIAGLVPGAALELIEAEIEARRTNALGHMRAAEYVALFDDAFLAFIAATGITDPDLKHGATSPFLLDLHTTYLRELKAGDRVRIALQVLETDPRRARVILLMRDALTDARVSTCELLILNFDMATRRPAPWTGPQLEAWGWLVEAHAGMLVPPEAGRAIGPLVPRP